MEERHCRDEALLALLGSPAVSADAESRRHVDQCLDCRARLKEFALELDVNDGVPDDSAVIAEWRRDAKSRFRARRLGFDSRRRWRTAVAWGSGGSAAAVLIGFGWFFYSAPPERPLAMAMPLAEQLLETAQRGESVALKGPVRQRFRIEVESMPLATLDGSELEIDSDPSRRTVSVTWSSAGSYPHVLRRMVRAAGNRGGADLFSALGRSPADAEHIKSALAQWLSQRDWKPILLARDFALLRSQGAALSLRRSAQGMVITAELRGAQRRRVVRLELDGRSGMARGAWVTISEQGRTVTMHLILEENEAAESDPEISKGKPREQPADTASMAPELQPKWGADQILQLEYLLHQTGVCTRDAVDIKIASGRVLLTGVIEDDRRREQVLRRLSEIGAAPWLMVDIRSAVAMRRVAATVVVFDADVASRDPDRFPAELRLREYVVSLGKAEASAVNLQSADLAARLVSLSEDAVQQALAIKRLESRVADSAPAGELTVRGRAMLDEMVAAHDAELRRAVARLDDALLAPILFLAGRPAPGEPKHAQPANGMAELEESAVRINQQVLRLFSTSDERPPDVSEIARQLADELP